MGKYICIVLQYNTFYVPFFCNTHTHTGVTLQFYDLYECTFTFSHMPPCQMEAVGVSSSPGPFFGDNDGHFFFSVTDDRQN